MCAACKSMLRIDWERSDCAAPSMVEWGPRLHERSPSHAADQRNSESSKRTSARVRFIPPRGSFAGFHPNYILLGFTVPLNLPTHLLGQHVVVEINGIAGSHVKTQHFPIPRPLSSDSLRATQDSRQEEADPYQFRNSFRNPFRI